MTASQSVNNFADSYGTRRGHCDTRSPHRGDRKDDCLLGCDGLYSVPDYTASHPKDSIIPYRVHRNLLLGPILCQIRKYPLTSCKTGTDILLNFCMNFSSLKRALKFLEYKLKTCQKWQPTVHTALLPDKTELHLVRNKLALKHGGIISVQFLCIAGHRLHPTRLHKDVCRRIS
jgi:hypothetical protein